MSPSTNSSWTGGFQTRRRGNPEMRASDAERSAVADMLSKHYGDGRLDQAEFDERLGRAMNAKTHADFNGLFDDLPDLPGAQPPGEAGLKLPPPQPRRRGRVRSGNGLSQLLLFGLVIVGAIMVGHALIYSFYLPWLLIGVLAFLWLRGDLHRRNR